MTVVGLDVADNDNVEVPGPAGQPWGDGIVVFGTNVAILRNRVTDHRHAGIWLTSVGGASATRVQVRENVVAGNGVDVLVGAPEIELTAMGSCFADNEAITTAPPDITTQLACGSAHAAVTVPRVEVPDSSAPGRDFRLVPLPAPQPSMPGPVDARPAPVDDEPTIDVSSIAAPT